MPQRMRRDAGAQRGAAYVALEQPPHATCGDATAAVVGEERMLLRWRLVRSHPRPPQRSTRKVCEVRTNGEVIDAPQIELIARHGEVVVAQKGDEGLEIVAICRDRVGRNIALVGEVVEKLSDFARHVTPSKCRM